MPCVEFEFNNICNVRGKQTLRTRLRACVNFSIPSHLKIDKDL